MIRDTVTHTNKKTGKEFLNMDEQTRLLLEECSSGCKMAVNSLEQTSEFIKDSELLKLIENYTEKHRQLEAEAVTLLNDSGNEDKEPGAMASTFAWFTTEMKLTFDSSNSQIAKLLIDGCNMGIKTLGEKANELKEADKKALDLTRKIIQAEDELMKKLREYL